LTASNEEMPGSEEGVQPGHHHRLDVYGRERENTRAERPRTGELYYLSLHIFLSWSILHTRQDSSLCRNGERSTPSPRYPMDYSLKIWTNQNDTHRTIPVVSNSYGSSGRAPVADAPQNDLASKGAAVFREAKANVEDMISDAGDYAGNKGREAMNNVRGVGDTLAVAVEKSVTTRPYTTLALAVAAGFLFGATLAVAAGFLFGATWRRGY
jgi:ElaB/YqjD/DUF883 family membrane-anchored ribosome-binding protein